MPRAHDHGRGPWVLAAVGLLTTALGLRGPERATAGDPQCERVALVAGALVCDEALEIVDACGTTHVLRTGDVLDPESCDAPTRMDPDDLAALAVPIDPNRDDALALESLPGIGPVLAIRIVEGRPYPDATSLLAVKGIGPRTLARISPRLTFADPPP